MNCSDADLVLRAKAGDVNAFDQLVLRHQERVFALAYHILGDADDAADVQQETFMRAWSKLREFRGQAAFSTWLHRITVNACISKKRVKGRREKRESLETDERMARYADAAECQDRLVNALMVRDLLASIPVEHRTLLVLREVEEMSIEEIAEVTGSSVEAVRKQLYRVRKLFGERLRQHLAEGEL